MENAPVPRSRGAADAGATAAGSRRVTRAVEIGRVTVGAGHPVIVQSMCATRTRDVAATAHQIEALASAGAGIVRVAVDSARDVEALAELRQRTDAVLSVDLQENYRLADRVAPFVDKLRYNPGHLHHHERGKSWRDKVGGLVEVAARHDCALRVGVNCGSVDPALASRFDAAGSDGDALLPTVASALEHSAHLDDIGFHRYCVSIKDSHPERVLAANRRFARERPEVPLHLGVTEAGMPPRGVIKTRLALAPLLAEGIGDTLRVSLTLPFERKPDEVAAGHALLADLARGGLAAALPEPLPHGLDIISCPSCSRVENAAFVELAEQIREMTREFASEKLTVAVMGCRVNGPGETDDADLGLWCAPSFVNLKRGAESVGRFGYDEILPVVREELERLRAARRRG